MWRLENVETRNLFESKPNVGKITPKDDVEKDDFEKELEIEYCSAVLDMYEEIEH